MYNFGYGPKIIFNDLSYFLNKIVNYFKILIKTIVSCFFYYFFYVLKMKGYQLGSTCRTKFYLEW